VTAVAAPGLRRHLPSTSDLGVNMYNPGMKSDDDDEDEEEEEEEEEDDCNNNNNNLLSNCMNKNKTNLAVNGTKDTGCSLG